MPYWNFLTRYGRLKRIPRVGWIFSGISKGDEESVADHISRTTLIAIVISHLFKEEGVDVDVGRVAAMALLHDVAEAYMMDINRKFTAEFHELKTKAEKTAEEKILHTLPQSIRQYYEEILAEYHQEGSLEAQIVKFSDRIETILQAVEYNERGYLTENLKPFYSSIGELSKYKTNSPMREILTEVEALITKRLDRARTRC